MNESAEAKPLVMGLPPDLVFAAQGTLTVSISADALADGIRFDFMCGDEVDGSRTGLREYFEERGQGYVPRVPSSFHLALARWTAVTGAEAVTTLAAGARRWAASASRAASNRRRSSSRAGWPARPTRRSPRGSSRRPRGGPLARRAVPG
ncbi:MAG: hypothetical protein ACRDNZ_20505 [Streptosporangiaceae bacterium]